jgi:hypothetical protein
LTAHIHKTSRLTRLFAAILYQFIPFCGEDKTECSGARKYQSAKACLRRNGPEKIFRAMAEPPKIYAKSSGYVFENRQACDIFALVEHVLWRMFDMECADDSNF